MLDEWKRNTFVSIYKNKGDVPNCMNYIGIKLIAKRSVIENFGKEKYSFPEVCAYIWTIHDLHY
ncbi:hypothetical protein CR513_09986, partial [Mucuna pruriens]